MAGIHVGGAFGAGIAQDVSFDELVLNAASGLWKFLGTELAVFAITVVFAMLVRNTHVKHAAQKILGHMEPAAHTDDSVNGYADGQATKRRLATRTPQANRRQPALPVDIPMRAADNRSPHPLAHAPAATQPEPWRIVDEICVNTQSNASARAAARNIKLYQELLHVLGQSSSTVGEACWYARYSAFDLYGCMVQCVVRTSQCHLVERLMDDMAQQGISRPLSFYEAAMKQLAGQKQYQLALRVYDRLVQDGLTPSNVTCSCLVSFAAEVGEYDRALDFFRQLSASTTPSIRAYMTILRVHAKRQDWPMSLAMFREMQEKGVTLDNLALNVVLATGIAADKVEEVDALVAEGDVATPPITDVVSYNTLVKGYLQRSDLTTAMGLLDRMQKHNIKPNAITFNTMIERAARSFQNGQAWNLLSTMRDFGVKPDRLTCSILIRGLGKHPLRKQIQDCVHLLQEAGSCCDYALLSNLQGIVIEAATRASDPELLAETRDAFVAL